MSGLPESKGMTATRFATHAGGQGVIHAANNRGASSNQMMPDGAGRLSTSFGQRRDLQMALRRLAVFRSDSVQVVQSIGNPLR